MFEIKMENLDLCFKKAKENNSKLVGVSVVNEDEKTLDVIITKVEDASYKLGLYKKDYDYSLFNKSIKKQKIVGCTYGDNAEEIYKDLV